MPTEPDDELLELICPGCRAKWSMRYAQLQQHRLVYKSAPAAPATPVYEEYLITCPNPRHGEMVVIRIAVEEG